jgi:two-component system, OmpR family, KDP operon response regulator KdpE
MGVAMTKITTGMHLALVVENDHAMQKVLYTMLKENGFHVALVGNGARALRIADARRPDIVLLDLGLPDLDGIEVIKSIRAWSAVPIIVVSAGTDEAQRIAAFQAGADDYVLKPFSVPELLARLDAALRRHARGKIPSGQLQLGQLTIDLARRTARLRDGTELRFTPLEHRIIETLNRASGQVVPHHQLMTEVWGPNRAQPCSLRVSIAGLRKKVEPNPYRPIYIVTAFGLGYRLIVNPKHEEGSRADVEQAHDTDRKTR